MNQIKKEITMSVDKLDPIECQMLGMSVDKIDLSLFKRADASGGIDTPAPSGQIPDFVLKRTAIVVTNDETQVE
jgi:hypothetical protein